MTTISVSITISSFNKSVCSPICVFIKYRDGEAPWCLLFNKTLSKMPFGRETSYEHIRCEGCQEIENIIEEEGEA